MVTRSPPWARTLNCWWLGGFLDISQQGSALNKPHNHIPKPRHRCCQSCSLLSAWPKQQCSTDNEVSPRELINPRSCRPCSPVAWSHFPFLTQAGACAFQSCQAWQLSNSKIHCKNNEPHYTISSFDPVRTIAATFLQHIPNASHSALARKISSLYLTSSWV